MTIDKTTARGFCGHGEPIPDSLNRVMYDIKVDLDCTNDTGTFIMLISAAEEEEEWLHPPGAEFEVGKIEPQVIANSNQKKIEIDDAHDVQEQLQSKE